MRSDSSARRKLLSGTYHGGADFSPDGKWLVVTNGAGAYNHLELIELASLTVVPLPFTLPMNMTQPAWGA